VCVCVYVCVVIRGHVVGGAGDAIGVIVFLCVWCLLAVADSVEVDNTHTVYIGTCLCTFLIAAVNDRCEFL
jgi:hypothetical protein